MIESVSTAWSGGETQMMAAPKTCDLAVVLAKRNLAANDDNAAYQTAMNQASLKFRPQFPLTSLVLPEAKKPTMILGSTLTFDGRV